MAGPRDLQLQKKPFTGLMVSFLRRLRFYGVLLRRRLNLLTESLAELETKLDHHDFFAFLCNLIAFKLRCNKKVSTGWKSSLIK